MAETYAELRTLSDEELMRRHDLHAPSVSVATAHYLEEMARRQQERATDAMLTLTQEMHRFTMQMRNITIAILIATVVGLALGVIALLKH